MIKKSLGLLVLFAGLLVFAACQKKEIKEETSPPPPSPDPYTYSAELQSSKDISFATLAITDLDMMVAYAGEEQVFNTYFDAVAGATSTTTVIRDHTARQLVWNYNKNISLDGKKRIGSVFAYYAKDAVSNPQADPNAKYYRDYGFVANLSLASYQVAEWNIQLFDPEQRAYISNKVTSTAYNPSVTNLTWEIKGKFKFNHALDPARSMIWDGTLVKTLINTSDPAVFDPSKQKAINWNLAKVSYSGTITGVTSANVPFNCVLSSTNPVQRDFNCALTVGPGANRYHPFIGGVATFTTSNFHPRTLNFGPGTACDKSGTVSFLNETHTVEFD